MCVKKYIKLKYKMFRAYKIFPLGVICGSLGTHAYNYYKNDKFLYTKKLEQLNKETKEIQEETKKVLKQTDDILRKLDD